MSSCLHTTSLRIVQTADQLRVYMGLQGQRFQGPGACTGRLFWGKLSKRAWVIFGWAGLLLQAPVLAGDSKTSAYHCLVALITSAATFQCT